MLQLQSSLLQVANTALWVYLSHTEYTSTLELQNVKFTVYGHKQHMSLAIVWGLLTLAPIGTHYFTYSEVLSSQS